MASNVDLATRDESEAPFLLFWSVAVEYKAAIAFSTGIGLVLATVLLWVSPKEYQAHLELAPSDYSSNDRGAILGGLGSVGSLVGMDFLGNEESLSAYQEFIELLNSRKLAMELFDDKRFAKTIFSNRWNESKNTFELGSMQKLKDLVLGLFGFPKSEPPGPQDMQQYLNKNLLVRSSQNPAKLELSFNHKDPDFAVEFLNAIFEETDRLVRESTRVRVETQTSYLRKKLETTPYSSSREALFALLVAKERDLMMLSGDVEYAARIIDPTTASNSPVKPRPVSLYFVFAALGLLSGFGYALACVALKEGSSRQRHHGRPTH